MLKKGNSGVCQPCSEIDKKCTKCIDGSCIGC